MEYQQKPWLKFYDPKVDENVGVKHESLYDFLENAVTRFGEKIAFTFHEKVWSYNDSKWMVDRLAAALHREGLKKGDRVAIMLPNCPQYLFTLFAVFRLGGIAVQVNPMDVEREIEFDLADSGAKFMISLDSFYSKIKKVQLNTQLKNVIVVSFSPKKIELAEGDHHFDEFLQEEMDIPEVSIDPHEDVAIIQYTGGTTGIPKGVMLTHYNLLANFNQTCDFIYNTWEEIPDNFKMISVLPMFHVYGLSAVALCGLREGANQIIIPRFEVKEIIEIIKREKPLIFAGVPTMFFAMNSQPEWIKECLWEEMWYVGSGGAPLPVEQAKTFEKITGCILRDGYGLSEAAPVVAFNPPFLIRKHGSIGIPVQSTVIRVVRETEDGHIVDVPVGEEGELIVKGPQVMKGYWNRPKDTEEVLKNGWLFTGDIGRMDDDGYFYILDRKKDMIIASGYNVYPREIEEVLYQMEEVEEALVIGIPDEYRGETVKAFIKLKPGANVTVKEILQFGRDNLAPYKAPKEVEILAELPKSSVGKLLRRVLRDQEIAAVKS